MDKVKGGPLAGFRVIEFAHVIAGPMCARMLADQGAAVIKVERPPAGDIVRHLPIHYAPGRSGYFEQYNLGKKSIVIDLRKPEGVAVAKRLVAVADVVVENLSPGQLAQFGLGWEQLRALNPRLVMCSLSSFGQTGPYASRPGYGQVAEAKSGLMSLTGEEGGPPLHFGTPLADMNMAVHAFGGICAALLHRERTGEGQYLDLGSLDCLFAIIDSAVQFRVFSRGTQDFGRYGLRHPSVIPAGVFPTQRGWVTMAALGDASFRNLATAMGRPEMAEDPRWATNDQRILRQDDVYAAAGEWIARFPSAEEAEQTLDALGVVAAKVNSVAEAMLDPQLVARGMLTTVDLPGFGPAQIQNSPFRFSSTPAEVRGPAPRLGEHNDEVLSTVIGCTDEEIERLKEQGAIFVAPVER